ncbi:hypothetical protein Tco_1352785 [Tanacetum coccineum]
MAVVGVPQTLEYRGSQLNAAPVLEVENFTNWKKRGLCAILLVVALIQMDDIWKNTGKHGSFGEETDKITDLYQICEEVLFTERGDDVAGIKRRRRDLSSVGVKDLVTAS